MPMIAQVKIACTVGSSNKFWTGRIFRDKQKGEPPKYRFVAQFGKIGATGQTVEKPTATVFKAFELLLSKLKEKTQKGYTFLPGSLFASWQPFYEMDLKTAANRFALQAVKLEGWREPQGMRDFLSTTKTSRPEFVEDGTDDSESSSDIPTETQSIKKILEQRRKAAMVTI